MGNLSFSHFCSRAKLRQRTPGPRNRWLFAITASQKGWQGCHWQFTCGMLGLTSDKAHVVRRLEGIVDAASYVGFPLTTLRASCHVFVSVFRVLSGIATGNFPGKPSHDHQDYWFHQSERGSREEFELLSPGRLFRH